MTVVRIRTRLGQRVSAALVVGAGLGIVASITSSSGSAQEVRPVLPAQIGEMSPAAVSEFGGFPVYGLTRPLAGLDLTLAREISSRTLSQAGSAPVETVMTPSDSKPQTSHAIFPEFVSLIYGTCDASTAPCAAPLEIQIWRSCNRSLDDYELAPGRPYPREELVVRGTKAAWFGDRLELYAGSVTIVIFGGRELATQAAEALQPLNAMARAEASTRAADLLPSPRPEAACG